MTRGRILYQSSYERIRHTTGHFPFIASNLTSLSFGEIISVSGEDDGELTADEIDDEVWDDCVNGDIEGKGGSIN